jgi:hypothetical protein
MGRQPTPPTISYKAFAEACDVSPAYIGQLVKEGVIPRQGHGRIPVIEGFGTYVRHLRGARKASPESDSKTKVANARAAEISLRVAREERKLIPLDEARDILAVFFGATRAEIESLPPGVTRDPELRHKIRAKCDDLLNRLADLAEERASALSSGVDATEALEEDDA